MVGEKKIEAPFFKRTGVFIFFLVSLLSLLFPWLISLAPGVTPLRYYKHYQALIEAVVVEISYPLIPTLDTNKLMSGKSREDSVTLLPLEKVHLRVTAILSSEMISRGLTSIIKTDSIIIVTNPWPNQKAPFKSGDQIRGEVQLVSTDQNFDSSGKENQWWFYNPEEKNSNSPPRNPFKHIKFSP